MKSVTSGAELILSVSGLRGIVGDTLTDAVAARFVGAFLHGLPACPRLCLGRDGRPTGAALEEAVIETVVAAGGTIERLGIVATPTVSAMVRELSADGGLVVTASHNPAGWNGLKCLDALGGALAPDAAAVVIDRYRSAGAEPRTHEGTRGAVRDVADATSRHVQRVIDVIDPARARAAGVRVVLDSVNAGGCAAGRAVLEAYGCDTVHLHGEPTGAFPHPPEPLRENLEELASRVAAEHAAVGFAQDPDADRLAIVDEQGVYIGEECTLALAAWSWLGGRARQDARVAANLSTSRLIDHVAPGRVIRTPVGEANVVAGMRAHDAAMGGEGNGGVIIPDVCWTRDSISSMALILDLLAREGRPLSTLVADLPNYEMIKEKIDLADLGGREAVASLLDRIAGAFPDQAIDRADGVRIDFADGWVHVRPSNTEPIARIIAEAGSAARASELVRSVRAVL